MDDRELWERINCCFCGGVFGCATDVYWFADRYALHKNCLERRKEDLQDEFAKMRKGGKRDE